MTEDDDVQDLLDTPAESESSERVLAGEFRSVRVFMTNKLDGGKVRKWSDLKLAGALRIILL